MTDESHEVDPAEEPVPPQGMPVPEHDDQAVLEGAGDFTSGEGLVVFAGFVLLAVWLIFTLILETYGLSEVVVVLAAFAALLPRVDRRRLERFHSLPVLLKAIGYVLFALGVFSLVIDVRFGGLDDFGSVIGALGSYAGYVMALIGARQIEI